MNKKILSLIAAGAITFLAACSSQNQNTTRGAGVGAGVGAVIGGIIGHQSGEAGAGAALGAAAGGLAGGAYGKSKDNQAYNNLPRDTHGYNSDDYYRMLNSDEKKMLEKRAAGRTDMPLTMYLTEVEKENLRRRSTGQNEIGR
ncbi:glycine zipper domain-containing protein [Oleiharenicola lentus]|uniref:glycine zipper domain-containing protein n=1 Tax=Oleiharenicola lentus TaxID=2508720 RepID=UPI003F670C07